VKALAIALAIGATLTVDQRDLHRSSLDSPASAVSGDGRYVAFVTFAQLAGADTDNGADVYVLDRIGHHVTFEGTDVAGNVDAYHPDLSADGHYLVYEIDGNIVWRDRTVNVTRIVGKGQQPSIADNGGIVVFRTDRDVYSVDLRTNETRRVSLGLPGFDGTVTSSVSPSVSADGRYVAFSTRVARAKGTPPAHVFVRDTQLNVTRRVGDGWAPSISGDGRFVAFVGPSSGLTHIFIADLQTGSTELITRSVRRGKANGSSANPAVSSDGSVVVFQSQANDLVREDDFNLLWDVFTYSRSSRAIARISGDPDGAWMEPSIGPAIDDSGSVIAFSSRHPTGAADKRNDFDLYVATVQTPLARTIHSQ
jgi:Tol biopolymer transport system component